MCQDDLLVVCDNIIKDLSLTPAEVTYVEEVPQSQSASEHWHKMRVGRITASVAHDFLHYTRDDLMRRHLHK